MRTFLHTHHRKIGHGVIIATIVVSTTVLIPTSTPVIMYLTPSGNSIIEPGEMTQVDVNVNARIPIDSLGATLSYPKDIVEIVGISKEKSFFDLWTEDTIIHEETGHIVFSGGTTDQAGLTGTGTIMTVTLKGRSAGEAVLSFDNVRIYPHDGTGKPVNTEKRSISFAIAPKSSPTPQTFLSRPTSNPPAATPSPDLNGDGRVSLSDLSILMTGLMSTTYSPRYDLNADGVVGLGDFSIILSQL